MFKNWGLSKKELKFWLIWLILNCILFLPIYVFSFSFTDPIPFKGLFLDGWYEKFRYYYTRANYDVFRLSFDYIIIFALYYFIRKKVSAYYFKIVTVILVVILLAFQFYDAFFRIIYRIPPSFFNDLEILINGFNVVTDGFSIVTLLSILSICLFIAGLGWLVVQSFNLLAKINFNRLSVLWIILILTYAVVFLFRYGFKSSPNLGLHFVARNFVTNIKGSYRSKKQLDLIKPADFLKQGDEFAPLEVKPNIFVLFVESYGSLVLNNDLLSDNYAEYITLLTAKLSEKGFHGYSGLSKAPVTGGGSWLSYASFQYGYKITQHSTFFHLLKNKTFHQYPHLFNWLKSNGYHNYRLNSLYESGNYAIPWDLYDSFYATDDWIRFNDLNYEGILYGYGPAPPDQYALNYSYHEIIKKSKTNEPFSLFFISKNSHNPFLLPHHMKSDWKAWNDEKGANQPSRFFHKPAMENYGKAIEYQLKYVIDFICNTEGNNLFIILGDHQPPVLESEGFHTPVHIVSKDSVFLQGLSNYGFSSGLMPNQSGVDLNHEGLYSILKRQLLLNYGPEEVKLPNLKPNGITLENLNQ